MPSRAAEYTAVGNDYAARQVSFYVEREYQNYCWFIIRNTNCSTSALNSDQIVLVDGKSGIEYMIIDRINQGSYKSRHFINQLANLVTDEKIRVSIMVTHDIILGKWEIENLDKTCEEY